MRGNFFKVFSVSTALIGAVIGAGFISGAEIVRFLGGAFILPTCFLLFILTFIILSAMLSYSGIVEKNKAIILEKGHLFKFFNSSVYVCSFIVAVGMCAGADALVYQALQANTSLPTLSVLMLIISYLFCSKGVKGVARFNCFLVPLIIAVIFAVTIQDVSILLVHSSVTNLTPVFIYSSMNCFLAAPLVKDCGRELSRRQIFLCALITSLVLSVCAYFILCKTSGSSSMEDNLPMISALNKNAFLSVLLTAVTSFGIITTLVSVHYPFVKLIEKSPLKHALNALLGGVVILASRLRFYVVVKYAYPVIGCIGLAYCTILTYYFLKPLFSSVYKSSLNQANDAVHCSCKRAKKQGRGIN